jgi:hypothetical protein
MALSRPVPTAIDAVISASDQSLLEFAYTASISEQHRFFKCVAFEYGPAIRNLPLRHAVLAWCASLLPHVQFKDVLECHKERARRLLIRKLGTPAEIEEADVFAAWILGSIFNPRPVSRSEITAHLNGSIAMMRFVEKSKGNSQSKMLSVFGPLVRDDTMQSCSHASLNYLQISESTFAQRVGYYQELRFDERSWD